MTRPWSCIVAREMPSFDIWNKFIRIRVVLHWNRFPGEAMDFPSLKSVRMELTKALSNLP